MKRKRIFQIFLIVLTLALCLCAPAFAAGGDVAGAVEQTWTDASSQIKTVVDNVVFPALSMVLAIAFFAKLAMATLITANMGSSSGRARHPVRLPGLRPAGPQLHLGHHRDLRGENHAERRI